MPRVAFGDLLVDVEVPASFSCEYSLSGSLLAQSAGGDPELSTIRVQFEPGATTASLPCPLRESHALYFRQRRSSLIEHGVAAIRESLARFRADA